MKRLFHFMFIGWMTFVVGNTACAEPAVKLPVEVIHTAVHKEIDAGLFPGVVVLVGKPGEVLFHEAYGHSYVVPKKIKMKKDDLFDLASITKVVATGTAVGVCIDEGRLKFDDLVKEKLAGMTGIGVDGMTIDQLGTHTSGFSNFAYFRTTHGEAMLGLITKSSPVRKPGVAYQYSDTNAILLSLIVEEATEKSFGKFCEQKIFKPLGMKNTRFGPLKKSERIVPTSLDTKGTIAIGVINDEQARFAKRPVGNAGLFSNAADLAIFCEMMLGKGFHAGKKVRILSETTHAEFTKNRLQPPFPGRGFCWKMFKESSHKLNRMSATSYGHTGWTGQSIWLDPEKQLFVIVLTNRTHPKRIYGKVKTKQYRARKRIGDAVLDALGL